MQRTVILFMVDQLAAKWLELASNGIVDLPNFAALQAEGVSFANAFTTNPVCSPSRASIATGMSSSSHGVSECGYDLDPKIPTFMQALQKENWCTGAFGKLHFITQLETSTPNYHPYGFDVVCNTEDLRAGEWIDWVKQHHPEHYQAALSTVWMTMAKDLHHYGPDEENLHAQIIAAQEKYPESITNAYPLPFPAEVSQTAWITERAADFLRERTGDVFAQISYVQPHNPFTPPAEYVDRVNVDAIPAPTSAAWRTNPIPYYQQPRYAQVSYEVNDWRRERQLYFADLAHLDHELGRIRQVLQESGRAENCLFIFTSDHGEMLHDQGLTGKWERHYDPCIRVPLIVSAPGVQPARRHELVQHEDITATIYDWTGVAVPTVASRHLDNTFTRQNVLHGNTLLPLMISAGETVAKSWRTGVLIQSNNSHFAADPKSWARTLRTAQHRLTRHLGGGGEQLFDLIADPDEQHNLIEETELAPVRETLRTELSEQAILDAYPNSTRQLFALGTW